MNVVVGHTEEEEEEEEKSLSYMLVILNITGMVSSQRLNYCIVTDFLLLLILRFGFTLRRSPLSIFFSFFITRVYSYTYL